MKVRTGFVALVLTAASVALAPSASATPVFAPPVVRAPVAPPVHWSVSTAYENNMHGGMDVAPTAALTGVPVLAGFRLRFGNGDHQFKRAAVLANGRTSTLSLADQNGDDPFRGAASWALVDSGRTGSVTAIGGGRFEIKLPTPPLAGHKLVLTGFELRRRNGTDANVRSIGVWLDQGRNVARVMLMDDQGPDFRGFEGTLGSMFLPGAVPLGEFKATADTMMAGLDALNRSSPGRFRPFAATVQYAWIPDAAVASTDVLTGTSRAASSGKRMPANAVLQGFEFYFGNGDHHLMDLGVMGPLLYPPPSAIQTPPGEVIAFQDSNRDDPIHWSVAVASLKPSIRSKR